MTREQYIQLKQELKELASSIKHLKPIYKNFQREGKYRDECATIGELIRRRKEYRVKHIFMSLVRGKTREQIERNPRYEPNEQALIDLCTKYDVDFDTDMVSGFAYKLKVISVKQNWPKPVPGEMEDVQTEVAEA